jgi:hypothetical protein
MSEREMNKIWTRVETSFQPFAGDFDCVWDRNFGGCRNMDPLQINDFNVGTKLSRSLMTY